jgi:hypothetical protein
VALELLSLSVATRKFRTLKRSCIHVRLQVILVHMALVAAQLSIGVLGSRSKLTVVCKYASKHQRTFEANLQVDFKLGV